jgi:hypothetical protein
MAYSDDADTVEQMQLGQWCGRAVQIVENRFRAD